MESRSGKSITVLYCLLAVLGALQIGAVVLLVRFSAESLKADGTLLERSSSMMEEIFPAMRNDLSEISENAAEIRKDVSGLREQVSKIDERGREIADGVSGLNRQVEGLDRSLTGFFGDKTGLVWGQSLNPYVLLGILAVIACSVPVWLWVFRRNRPDPAPSRSDAQLATACEFAGKLDRLHGLVGQALAVDRDSPPHGPELQRLMEETERLIEEARVELAWLSQSAAAGGTDRGEKTPDRLN